ncbi:hypothetical protein E2I00_012824 [Balaenoptera physalus]|uniref:AKNA domain-containing protein n=1 Tax=Balaenoptera physalus TaxID=9770 RepID=A0A6A1QLM7_BALPH|nr:hypothetical protein E2I00_012824 [Balaenoptera physalus]
MASSGTEVHWAESGLGKGPRRRRWAWAEKGKDADGSGACSLVEEAPFPSATSPELLEDFRLAQQCLQPLEWGPDSQPDGRPDPESGESAEEEFEAEDVDSPESSNLPLSWPPQQDPQLDMTEEEADEAVGGPEVQEAGESSPRLGSARSWSSGTVSLNPPSGSLDSTWEGETDGPAPAALAETSPQSSSHHLLNPNDRTGGSVTLATATEFQEPSAPPAQSVQCPADRWRRETTSLSCPQPGDQSWKRTRISPKPLPSRFTGSISPLKPPPRPARQDRPPPRPGATLAGHSSSDAPKYGQGRLNYPLPDFSKVGPRVKFPKDESYRPPKARNHSRLPEGPARPLIFKSPAEIVRELLSSSGEVCPGEDPPPTHPTTRVPREFQTPEQATKLVHQLQEDYHKLLTKYAEAENTIDQLRLGAKVNLYLDPPQPSHSIHTGTMPQGTKVLSFTIPQPHSVERWPGPAKGLQASEASGWPSAEGDLNPSSPPSTPALGWLPENPDIAQDQPSAEQAQELTSRASRFLAKVESFVELLQAGQLTPQDQLKVFQQLKAAHAALEEEYLKACREQHVAQQLAGSTGTPGRFDPGRELEAEIFQLGVRLDELKGHIDQSQQEPEPAGSDSALDSSPAMPSPNQPTGLPSPLEQAPTPAIQTLCPELDAINIGPHPLHVNLDLSATGNEVEDRPLGLPTPLRHKELRVEQDFHGLLERYLSVKSLPEALRLEEEEGKGQGHTLEVEGPASAPGKAAATRLPTRQPPAQAERSHGGPLEYEPWMASPETDSGFVGSETSRVSPLTQTPEHRLCQIRSRAQRPPPGQDSPLGQRAPSFCLERALAAEMGQEYHVLTPKTVPRSSGPVSCPHCRPARTEDPGDAGTKDPLGPSHTETQRCPLCGRVGSSSKGEGPDSASSAPEMAATRRNASSTSSPKQRSKRAGSPPGPPPALWYLAAAPSAPAPPAFAYVSSVPLMPYPSATVYYAPPAPTSAPSARAAAEWPPAVSSRPAGRPRHSIQLDLEDLEELNKALSRAVQAAESVRSTTKLMSRSLSADLRQARGLRGSCLF